MWVAIADGKAAVVTSDGIGAADPPTGHIFASNSLIDTNAKPTELSAMP